MIILIYGKSDSGKSTLAKKITNELKLKPIQQILPRNFNLEGWRPEKGAWCNDRTWMNQDCAQLALFYQNPKFFPSIPNKRKYSASDFKNWMRDMRRISSHENPKAMFNLIINFIKKLDNVVIDGTFGNGKGELWNLLINYLKSHNNIIIKLEKNPYLGAINGGKYTHDEIIYGLQKTINNQIKFVPPKKFVHKIVIPKTNIKEAISIYKSNLPQKKWYQDLVVNSHKYIIGRSNTLNKLHKSKFPNPNGLTHLDIGALTGSVCLFSKQMGAKSVTGIEINKKRCDLAQNISKALKLDIKYVTNSLEKYLQETENFDIITAFAVLHYVKEKDHKKVMQLIGEKSKYFSGEVVVSNPSPHIVEIKKLEDRPDLTVPSFGWYLKWLKRYYKEISFVPYPRGRENSYRFFIHGKK